MFRTDNSKLLVISDKDSLIAKLKIQLQYDNLTQIKFFKIILDAYLNRDERLISLLEDNTKVNKIKRKIDKKELKQTVNDFALEENDIENIFDLIEKENSEL